MSFWKRFFRAKVSSRTEYVVFVPGAVLGLLSQFALAFGGPLIFALVGIGSGVYLVAARAVAVWAALPPLVTSEARLAALQFEKLSGLPRARRRVFAQELTAADRELQSLRDSLSDVQDAVAAVRAVDWSAPQLADELFLAREELESRVRGARERVFALDRDMQAACQELEAERAADDAVRAARALTRARVNT